MTTTPEQMTNPIIEQACYRLAADGHLVKYEIVEKIVSEAIDAELAKQRSAETDDAIVKRLAPDRCPITRREYFMAIEHPERGWVATYGGPFDSFTIPEPDEDGSFRSERFDHDAGEWVEGGNPEPFELVSEREFNEMFDAREKLAALSTTPPESSKVGGGVTDEMVSVTKTDANNYCRILSLLGMEEEGDPVAWVESTLSYVHDRNAHADLSTVASRDREDAENFRWLLKRSHPGIGSYYFGPILAKKGESLEQAIVSARQENKP